MELKEWKGNVVEVGCNRSRTLEEVLAFVRRMGHRPSPSIVDGVGVLEMDNNTRWFIPVEE
jgi:hypothetical protein